MLPPRWEGQMVWRKALPTWNLLSQNNHVSSWPPPFAECYVFDGLWLATSRTTLPMNTSYWNADPSVKGFTPWGASHTRMIPLA